MVFPLPLAHVFTVAFEEELSTEWNSALTFRAEFRRPSGRFRHETGLKRHVLACSYTSFGLLGMLTKTPELVENLRGLHTVTSMQASALLGLLKLDFLDRTQRFIDVEAGMLVEYIKTVDEGLEWLLLGHKAMVLSHFTS